MDVPLELVLWMIVGLIGEVFMCMPNPIVPVVVMVQPFQPEYQLIVQPVV